MAPIKLEDNIREKLEDRELEPSKGAWNKLSEQLDANSERKINKVIWYAIAASFIGILIAVSVFNSRNSESIENDTDFVKINSTESEVERIDESGIEGNTSEEKSSAIIASEEPKSIPQNSQLGSEIEKQLPKKKEAIVADKKQKNTEAIAKIPDHSKKEKLSQLPKEIVAKNNLAIDKKINELVAQVELMQQNNGSISDDEIDALLANAERDLKAKKIISTTKIDPLTLLGDVELELDNSFRNKIFNALGDGYDIIKTAVVNRNN